MNGKGSQDRSERSGVSEEDPQVKVAHVNKSQAIVVAIITAVSGMVAGYAARPAGGSPEPGASSGAQGVRDAGQPAKDGRGTTMVTKPFANVQNVEAVVASWVNEECHPDSVFDVRAFQELTRVTGGALDGRAYTLHVYCVVGGRGVRVLGSKTDSWLNIETELKRNPRTLLLGQYDNGREVWFLSEQP